MTIEIGKNLANLMSIIGSLIFIAVILWVGARR